MSRCKSNTYRALAKQDEIAKMPKATEWSRRERHPRELRFDEIEILVQDGLNAPYLDPATQNREILRFHIGSPIVTAQEGLFYSANIVAYHRLIVPDSMYPIGTDLPWHKRIPTVIVHFDGWKGDNSEAVESELFTAMFPARPVDTLALLMAHEWNLLRRDQLNVPEEKLGVGVFLMNEDMYETLQRSWQKDTGQTMSFAAYCGREPGPYYSTKPLITGNKSASARSKHRK